MERTWNATTVMLHKTFFSLGILLILLLNFVGPSARAMRHLSFLHRPGNRGSCLLLMARRAAHLGQPHPDTHPHLLKKDEVKRLWNMIDGWLCPNFHSSEHAHAYEKKKPPSPVLQVYLKFQASEGTPQSLFYLQVNPGICRGEFAERRSRLAESIRQAALTVPGAAPSLLHGRTFCSRHLVAVSAAQRMHMYDSVPYPFRQNSNFRYYWVAQKSLCHLGSTKQYIPYLPQFFLVLRSDTWPEGSNPTASSYWTCPATPTGASCSSGTRTPRRSCGRDTEPGPTRSRRSSSGWTAASPWPCCQACAVTVHFSCRLPLLIIDRRFFLQVS